MSYRIKTENVNIPDYAKHSNGKNVNKLNGTYLGIVVDNEDAQHSGRIEIRIAEFGQTSFSKQRYIGLLVSPYGGTTAFTGESLSNNGEIYGEDEESTNGTPKSFGMWIQPPPIGTEVVVIFTPSKSEGLVVGSLFPRNLNHTLGGRASAETHEDTVEPVGEKNPADNTDDTSRPIDPIAKGWLKEQGLEQDYARGHSMSSARRESPSRVFGLTTLNGHVFTMDDGDTNGDSKNMRLRTRGGAQVLLDDTNKMVFVNNHNGSAWIEIDEHGNIDIYSAKSVSVHAEEDLNFHADRDINIQAGKDVNIKANDIKIEATNNYDLYAGTNVIVEALNNIENKCTTHIETSSMVYMNSSSTARAATKPTVNSLAENSKVSASVAARVPEHHPWDGASKIQENAKIAKGNL